MGLRTGSVKTLLLRARRRLAALLGRDEARDDAPVMECPRERDVLDLVAIGQWPVARRSRAGGARRAVRVCADLAAVAVAVADLARRRRPGRACPTRHSSGTGRSDPGARRRRAPSRAPAVLAQAAGLAALVVLLTIWWAGLSGWLGRDRRTRQGRWSRPRRRYRAHRRR